MATAAIPSKIQKRSQKAAWITAILTFIVPFGGYLYTNRYVLALISAMIWLGCLITSNPNDPDDPRTAVVAFMMFVTAIENTIAVFRARGSLSDIEQETIQHRNDEELRVQLLKLAHNNEGVTMASCIIETGKSTDEIRRVLQELERQDVMRSGNRESDGAVFYRVV